MASPVNDSGNEVLRKAAEDLGDSEYALRVAVASAPAGSATAANQVLEIAGLASIDGHVDGLEASASSIDGKLTGVATAAKQDIGNSSLSSIDGKLTTTANGVKVDVIASVLPSGAATSANQTTEIASLASIDGHVDGLEASATSIDGKLNSLGQKTMAASVPVVIASDQSTVPVSLASSPLPTGAATAANQTTEIASLASIDGHVDGLEASASSIDSKLTGVATTAKQDTGNTSLASIDGKVTTTANGIKVDVIASALPSGAATSAKQDTGNASLASIDTKLTDVANATNQATQTTALQLIDDVPAAMNTAFSKGAPAMGQLDDTGTTAATENNVAPVRITAQRAFHTNLRNDSGTEIGTSGAPVRTDPTGTTTQPVSDAGGSLTVDGTVAATQSGTWTVQPGNTANTTAWKVDGSAVTQPVSAASLPLPSGASTAAKQPALGTAGTASADVITVQGVASMTAIKVDGSGVTQPVSGTVAATQSGTWTVQPGNTANTTAWKVDGSAVTQPVSAASLPLPTGAATSANQTTEITSLQLIDDVPTALNAAFSKGAPAMGQLDDTSTTAATEDNCAPIRITAQRAAHANLRNNAGTEIGTSGAPVRTDPTGTTTQPISDAGGSITIDGNVGQSGTWTVQPGNTANTTAWKVDGSAVTQPVSAASLPLPSGAATSANQTTTITALQIIDDVPTAMNGAFVAGTPISGQLDDTSTIAATENNCAPIRITAQRAAHVNLRNNAGTEIGTSTTAVRVDPTGTTTQPVSMATPASTVGLGSGTLAIRFAAVGNITTTFASIFATGGLIKMLIIQHDCDKEIQFSFDAGVTLHLSLLANQLIQMDFGANGIHIASGVAIHARTVGANPGSGTVRFTAVVQ